MKLLLDGQQIDTAGSQDTYTLDASHIYGNYTTVAAYGTWDGATATLEFSVDSGTTWITAGSNTTFTANGGGNFWCNKGIMIRFSLSGAGAGTDISAGIV